MRGHPVLMRLSLHTSIKKKSSFKTTFISFIFFSLFLFRVFFRRRHTLYYCYMLPSTHSSFKHICFLSSLTISTDFSEIGLKKGVLLYYCYVLPSMPYYHLLLPFQSIHLHFFQNLSQNFSCVGCG